MENPHSKFLVTTLRAKVPDREIFIQKLNFRNSTVKYKQIEGARLGDKQHEDRLDWGRNALEKSLAFT